MIEKIDIAAELDREIEEINARLKSFQMLIDAYRRNARDEFKRRAEIIEAARDYELAPRIARARQLLTTLEASAQAAG